ncbi:CPBP family intramembrane glutamic endopeptidase [Robinsoniella peoriensis]|uniref:CPBP family intramembrane glutamic endopeptidase n=1 Tax=Robinsoniella peoriensis TaxID=180332 RepID=UPI00159F0E3F|nr:type II CAAX endopeptidase family protein [Robinsoniella peoriensis]
MFIAEGLVILLHFALGKNIFVGDVFDAETITLITYYGYIVIVGIALIYWEMIEKKPLVAMGLTKDIGTYFIGIAIGVSLLLLTVVAIVMTGNITYQGIFENADVLMILLLTGGFIIQGAAEEVLCRGIVLHALKEKTSLVTAIIVSTILFILPHWSSLFAGEIVYGVIGIINLILISVIFSFLTLYFKSIWAACGLHSFWNAFLYSVLGLNLSGNEETVTAIFNMRSVGDNIWNGSIYGIEASAATTIVLAFAAALIFAIAISPQ